MVRAIVHLVLHAAVPAGVALIFFRPRFFAAFALLMSGMLIDLDHLVADPMYDPNRCSIGFHALHAYPLAILYLGLAVLPKTRLVGLGLCIHLALDAFDCGWMHLES